MIIFVAKLLSSTCSPSSPKSDFESFNFLKLPGGSGCIGVGAGTLGTYGDLHPTLNFFLAFYGYFSSFSTTNFFLCASIGGNEHYFLICLFGLSF